MIKKYIETNIVRTVRWERNNGEEIASFVPGVYFIDEINDLEVMTTDGAEFVYQGDYIIRDAHDNIYVKRALEFEQSHIPLKDFASDITKLVESYLERAE